MIRINLVGAPKTGKTLWIYRLLGYAYEPKKPEKHGEEYYETMILIKYKKRVARNKFISEDAKKFIDDNYCVAGTLQDEGKYRDVWSSKFGEFIISDFGPGVIPSKRDIDTCDAVIIFYDCMDSWIECQEKWIPLFNDHTPILFVKSKIDLEDCTFSPPKDHILISPKKMSCEELKLPLIKLKEKMGV